MCKVHPSIAPYGVFSTADNKRILISIQNEREFVALHDALPASHVFGQRWEVMRMTELCSALLLGVSKRVLWLDGNLSVQTFWYVLMQLVLSRATMHALPQILEL